MLTWTHKRQLDVREDKRVSGVMQSGVVNYVLSELTEKESERPSESEGDGGSERGGLERWIERGEKGERLASESK